MNRSDVPQTFTTLTIKNCVSGLLPQSSIQHPLNQKNHNIIYAQLFFCSTTVHSQLSQKLKYFCEKILNHFSPMCKRMVVILQWPVSKICEYNGSLIVQKGDNCQKSHWCHKYIYFHQHFLWVEISYGKSSIGACPYSFSLIANLSVLLHSVTSPSFRVSHFSAVHAPVCSAHVIEACFVMFPDFVLPVSFGSVSLFLPEFRFVPQFFPLV